tara:strand:- start:58 stop:306 length:249 start_codon:yes stop_codon:yes gene_type:complete
MNSMFNFNPDEKRVQLAALLQDPTQPYRKYSGPLGAPKSGGGMGGLNDMLMKMAMQRGTQPGAPSAVGDFPTGSANPMSNIG